jgi:carboxymethylenebutenolidase
MKINADGSFNAYVCRPETGSATAPAIVVVQEIFGVNCDVRETCEELAGRGFIAVAPELFWREAPGADLDPEKEADFKRALALYQGFDLDRGVRDIAATIASLRTVPGGSGKVGVMGFCLGGLSAFLTAARTDVDAAVAYYGGSTETHLDEAAAVTAPLMIHLGEEDEYIPHDAQRRIAAAFAGKVNVEIFRYPGCSHAFARHSGAHYDAAAAAAANARTWAFLDRHLKGRQEPHVAAGAGAALAL